jgi:5-methylcytosine-specific restriction endonuclease McrA
MKSKRTKALEIPREVKIRVALRDNEKCILCGRPGLPEAHYISRAHGGLGIEQNIVTLCRSCHRRYDQTTERAALGAIIADYLRTQYHDWTPTELIYRKE